MLHVPFRIAKQLSLKVVNCSRKQTHTSLFNHHGERLVLWTRQTVALRSRLSPPLTLGKAFAIMAVMMHGPDIPTEQKQHNERHRIFMASTQYALSKVTLISFWQAPIGERK